ncbi:AP-4 complex accessory subunit RUSC2 [Brachyhypopomus gauderio]|uniref:AP-4 complex accessory subunit RUSC2 n=1 Tax=Brachyhypopomus gauderio TaxID=698409 RepID=UPI0040414FC4
MEASAKLAKETLAVQQLHLAHGQSGNLYSSVQRLGSPLSLSLTPSIVLPDADCNYQSHSRKSNSRDESEITHQTIENPRRYKSPATYQLNPFQTRDTRQKVFIPEPERNNNDDDLVRDNLHNYCEASLFELHRNSNITQNRALGDATESWPPYRTQCSASSAVCNHKVEMMHEEHDPINRLSDTLQHNRNAKSTQTLMDYEEQKYEDEESYNEEITKTTESHESCTQNRTDCVSNSLCNSSDGVLINFTAIYSTANAVLSMPDDLKRPAKQTHWSESRMAQDDDVKTILSRSPCGLDTNCNIYPLDCEPLSLEIPDCTARLQSQDHLITSAPNYYTLVTGDLSSLSSPSPVWSSMNRCSDVHSHGRLTPPAEYYLFKQPDKEKGQVPEIIKKDLQVDVDTELKTGLRVIKNLSKEERENKSHNKAHPPYLKCPKLNYHRRTGTQPQSRVEVKGHQNLADREAQLHVPSHPEQTDVNLSSCEPRSPSQTDTDLSSHDSNQQVTSFVKLAHCRKSDGVSPVVKNSANTKSTSPTEMKVQLGPNVTVITNQTAKISPNSGSSGICETPFKGSCASSSEVVRYTKAQRPTSLPIHPFILQPPSGLQHNKDLGSLLNKYISHLHGKTGTSRNTDKCKGLAIHLRASPLDRHLSSHLESSSDTCSTCSPSPVQSYLPPHWVQPNSLLTHTHPESDQKTMEPNLPQKSPVQNCLDENHPIPKQSCADPQKASVKHSLTVDTLQTSLPAQVSSLQIQMPGSQEQCGLSLHTPSLDIPLCISLASDTSLISVFGTGQRPPWPSVADLWTRIRLLVTEQHWKGDSVIQAGRAPEACPRSFSVNLLHKADMLKTLRSAVDLITAHFSSCKDVEEKIRLRNNLLCPSINKLVLGQLCPAIRNILQDGLRAFKRDLIVGQRHNNPWDVVVASTQPGPSTHIFHSLVSVTRKCSQLTSHSMKLNAFFLGLLNLHALEEWLRHLHTCADVVAEYYQPWAFLTLSQGPPCGSLFQELLLVLQPLLELPFDLHLLSELRLQCRPECSQRSTPPLSACPFLQIFSSRRRASSPKRPKQKDKSVRHGLAQTESCMACSTHATKNFRGGVDELCKPPKLLFPGEQQKPVCPESSRRQRAGWWLAEMGICSNSLPHAGGAELLVEDRERRTVGIPPMSLGNKPVKELQWAGLFGSRTSTPVTGDSTQKRSKPTQKSRLPSQWLKLGVSKVDLLAQSLWGGKTDRESDKCTISVQPQPHS